MFKKITFIILSFSLALFSGCVAQNRYRAIETELNSAQTQMEEDKKSFTDLQGENGSWWRIFAGHYETREGAIIERNKYGLADKIVLKATNASHMDVYNSEDEAENNMSLLLKEDFDPIF